MEYTKGVRSVTKLAKMPGRAKLALNPKGMLSSESKRESNVSKTAKALGLEDPYERKKKKKKDGFSGLRGFMDKFIKGKSAN